MKKRSLSLFAVVWGILMVAIISSTLTLIITSHTAAEQSSRWVSEAEYARLKRYERLDEVREYLEVGYYEELDEDALLLGAIHGMTDSVGDPYTFYYTPEQLTRSNEDSEGLYHGIGVLIQATEDGYIQVLRVYPDTPALAAGMKVGDVIVAVDGVEISADNDMDYNAAVNSIRGVDGTSVHLTIRRDDATLEMDVLRADVNVSYVSYEMLDDGIGYIAITQFSGDARTRFAEAIEYFEANNAQGLVIDVRNNPGGLLDQVVDIADSVLPQGVIVYIQDRYGARTDYYSDDKYCDLPLAVLVNDASASASEILAASVQAFDRGEVVGLTTYGKGIVQTLYTFEDGAGIQLTTASYYDRLDRSIHGIGVTPDIEVALEGDGVPLDPDPVSDNQLKTAIESVKRQIEAQTLTANEAA